MNISVIIPNYNGEELLKKNLPKIISELKKYQRGKIEIIVVDDFSTDNSVLYLQTLSEVTLFQNPQNMGFAKTVNFGVSKANGEILLLLNTDVYPEAGFLDPLLANFKDEAVFAVGCMDRSIEKDGHVLRGRGVGSWKRGFLVHSRGEVNLTDTLWVSGGSGTFRRSIWDKLGGMDPLFSPFYWEDIDLSYRALKSGYKLVFEPKSTVFHEHEKGVIKKQFKKSYVQSIVYRNMFYFVWTNATDLNLIIKHFIWLPYHFLNTLLKGEYAFYLGFIKAILNIPKVLYYRYNNIKLFTKTDKEVTGIYSK